MSLAVSSVVLMLAAIYIIPYRLLNDPGNSFYTFGYVGDEYLYAQRMQPTLAGATPGNPVNGIGDPGVISVYYLEDLCRGIMTVTGLDVVTFMWAWRFGFPLVLGICIFSLVASALPNRKRPWTGPFRLAAIGASVALLHALYDVVTVFPPLLGWIQRIPTGIEYPLAALTASALIALLAKPTAPRAVLMGLCGLALIYLRLYAAIPWGMATVLTLLLAIATHRVPWKLCALSAVVVAAGMAPWLLIHRHNAGLEVYQQMLQRYFSAVPYRAHPAWPTHLGFALGLGILAWQTPRWRIFIAACALTLPIMTFGSALLPIAQELVGMDRYGVFYFIAFIAAALLWLREQAQLWKGKRGQSRARMATVSMAGICVAGAAFTGWNNLTYDFDNYPNGPMRFIRGDLPYVPGYYWLEKNSPSDTLVLVDDGTDWGALRAAQGDAAMQEYWYTWWMTRDDLFQIVARRRSVLTNRLYTVAISNDALSDAGILFLGTFGRNDETPLPLYREALKRMTPDYIFWKKSAPVPRGFGRALKPFCTIVYSDTHCEIWRVNQDALLSTLK